jgi:hypothetical protein
MKSIRIAILFLAVRTALAAAEGPDIISPQGRIRVGGMFQTWKMGDSLRLSEFSIPLDVYYPVNRRFSLGLSTSQASTSGKYFSKLGGLTDAQASVNYYLEDKNLLLSFGCNLPSGKKELTFEEFATSIMLSQPYFNYQVPVFGQGLNLSPGFTWAKPMNDRTVIGLGASYQIKGKYSPIKDLNLKYKPGNDLLVTGGLDYQVNELTALSFDLTLTVSEKDKVEDVEVFKAGTKIMVAAQFKQYRGFDLVWLFGRFRSRSKSDIFSADAKVKTQRDELESMGMYRKRIDKQMSISFLVEARYFLKTDLIASAYQAGAGIMPEKQVSPNVKLLGRLKAYTGKDHTFGAAESIFGFEVGAGLEYAFGQ